MLPIPGAPDGKILRRMCRHMGKYTLVKTYHGLLIYQCLTCRKISSIDIRTEKTCLNCGKPLTGRQQNWCCSAHGSEVFYATDRASWRESVLKRDSFTCQRCGWKKTKETDEAYNKAWSEINREYRGKGLSVMKHHFMTLERSGTRQLEAHHITPLEWGGPEFDLANGVCYCHRCHDEVHRELNASVKR